MRRGTLCTLGGGLVLLALWSAPAARAAPPPCYRTFERPQRVDLQPAPGALLRIWVAYVEQGDGIVIQLPERFRSPGSAPGEAERVEILIDAGSFYGSDAERLARFLERLYPEGDQTLEHVVVSHHDKDHVAGFGPLAEAGRFRLGTIYHNGLASYLPQGVGLAPDAPKPANLVGETKEDSATGERVVSRAMAFFDDQDRLRADDLVEDGEDLAARLQAGSLQGVYLALAEALVTASAPGPPPRLRRVTATAPGGLVDPPVAQTPGPAFEVEFLWPPDPPRRFAQWSETINGNSVTFMLRYGDFEMLFTGDQNERSEEAMLAEIAPSDLACDVLKIPHHGSSHGLEEFFERTDPVVAVASMGRRGFGASWKHPSDRVISWLGGSHRVYHTHIHERRFRWDTIDDEFDDFDDFEELMVEPRHVLVETDGTWFRVVELREDADLAHPPPVTAVHRGDGTRWVAAARTAGEVAVCPD